MNTRIEVRTKNPNDVTDPPFPIFDIHVRSGIHEHTVSLSSRADEVHTAQVLRDLAHRLHKSHINETTNEGKDLDGIWRNWAEFKAELAILKRYPEARTAWARFKRRWWDGHSAIDLSNEMSRHGCEYLGSHVAAFIVVGGALIWLLTVILLWG